MGLDEFRESFDLPYLDFYRSMGVTNTRKDLDDRFRAISMAGSFQHSPFPFVMETLNALKSKGIMLCILSSHPQDMLDREIAAFGLGGMFAHALGGVHDKREAIGGLVGSTGAGADEILFVGDMAHDIEAGKTAGILTGAVLSGYHRRERLEGMEPNFIMNDIRDLRLIVEAGL